MKPLHTYMPKAQPIAPWSCPEQGEWEMEVMLALCNSLGIGSSDAIDLSEPWGDLMRDAWAERLDPAATARMLDQVSRGMAA